MHPAATHMICRRINKALAPHSLKIWFFREEKQYFVVSLDGSMPRQGPIYYAELADIAKQLDCLTLPEKSYGVLVTARTGSFEPVPYRFGRLALNRAEFDANPLLAKAREVQVQRETREAVQIVQTLQSPVTLLDAATQAGLDKLFGTKPELVDDMPYAGLTGISEDMFQSEPAATGLAELVTSTVNPYEGMSSEDLCVIMETAEAAGDYDTRDMACNAMPDYSDEVGN